MQRRNCAAKPKKPGNIVPIQRRDVPSRLIERRAQRASGSRTKEIPVGVAPVTFTRSMSRRATRMSGKSVAGPWRSRIRAARFEARDALPPSRDASRYDRMRDVPRLLPLLATELLEPDRETTPLAAHARLVAHLKRALRAERTRGKAGHWSYDLGRHSALLRAFRCEEAALHAAQPPQATFRVGCPDPSCEPDPTARRHSSARPSDSRAAGPTSRDIAPARGCSACAGAASAT